MTTKRRVQQQPAFILHHRPFRDTSQLLDVISRDYGRLTLVARGSRAARSRLRGLLRPFLPLRLSWVISSDLGTLTGAEIDDTPLTLNGDVLLSGYYLNELLLKFLHRHDPQPDIFAAYRHAVTQLCRTDDPAPRLREFEIDMLRLLGYALNLEFEASTNKLLDADEFYEYRVEQGPVRVARQHGTMVFSGSTLQGIHQQRFDDPVIQRAAGRLLREVITYHLDGKELKSRKVLLDLRRAKLVSRHGDIDGVPASTHAEPH